MVSRRLIGRWEKVKPIVCPNPQRFASTPDRPKIVAYFQCGRFNLRGPIDFLIDTGADSVVIMPDDAERLGIKSSHLMEGCPHITRGVGGTPVPLKYIEDVILEFPSWSKETTVAINFARLAVLFPSREVRRNKVYAGLPSLLGRSFLSFCHLDFTPGPVLLIYEGPEVVPSREECAQ